MDLMLHRYNNTMAKHPHKWQNPTGLQTFPSARMGQSHAGLQPSSTKGDLLPKALTEKPPEPQQKSKTCNTWKTYRYSLRTDRATELRTPGGSATAELCRAARSSSYPIGKYPHGLHLATVQISPSYTGFYDALWAQRLVWWLHKVFPFSLLHKEAHMGTLL